MANLLKISGPASALLLLAALLAAGARADWVTTAGCPSPPPPAALEFRVRQYPVDSDATLLLLSCNLTSVPQHELSGLPAVTTLMLFENKLRELSFLNEHVCANLTELHLGWNQLTEINTGTFTACTKLEKLTLNNNQLEFIHHSAFTALTNLTLLDLLYNNIRYIPDGLLASNGKLESLYLSGNRITHLPPEFVSRLKRASTGLHKFEFYDNPWHCACLIELLADVRRAGVVYYYTGPYEHDGSRVPVCVYTGAAPCCRRAPAGLLRAARGRGGR